MTKQRSLIVILLSLLAFGSILITLFSTSGSSLSDEEPIIEPVADDTEARPTDMANYELAVQEEKRVEGFMTVTYLLMQSAPDATKQEAFNKALRSFITERSIKMETDAKTALEDARGLETFKADPSCMTHEMTVAPISHNAKLISMGVSYYFSSCGAHPSYAMESFNYDLETGSVIDLADVFGSDALETLSAITYEKMKVKLGKDETDEWLKEGTAPDEKNFDAVTFSEQGVIVSFDDYQIATHAESPEPLLIPWSDLKTKIKEGSPVLSLIKS